MGVCFIDTRYLLLFIKCVLFYGLLCLLFSNIRLHDNSNHGYVTVRAAVLLSIDDKNTMGSPSAAAAAVIIYHLPLRLLRSRSLLARHTLKLNGYVFLTFGSNNYHKLTYGSNPITYLIDFNSSGVVN